MLKEIRIIALAIYWALLLGLIAPGLVSAKSDSAVFAGLSLLIVSAYLTYRLARRWWFPTKKRRSSNTRKKTR